MLQTSRLFAAVLVAGAAFSAGCGQSSTASVADPAVVAAQRAKFLLAEEPAGAQGILEFAEAAHAAGETVLVGQVGGVPNPWTAGKAAFIIADPVTLMQLEEEGHDGCTGDDCPFCKKKKDQTASGLAMVRFEDASGQLVPHDARELFDLAEKTTVVVRGQVRRDELGYVVIAAQGLYIRK